MRRLVVALVGCLLVAVADVASAYIDPGSGSMILQTVIAIIAGLLLSVRIWWTRISSMFLTVFRRRRNVAVEGSEEKT